MDVYDVEVEAQAKTIEEAKKLAIEKLGLPEDRVTFTVVSEGKVGFLGIGTEPAVITARAKPPEQKKRRRKRRRNDGAAKKGREASGAQGQTVSAGGAKRPSGNKNRNKSKRDQERGARKPPAAEGKKATGEEAGERSDVETPDIQAQADVAREFVEGLLKAFGLEGKVETKIDDDILLIDVSGDQTEALVGSRGVIMQSVLELTRTVVQRKTYGAPRMRIDISGYAERRREALKIYAAQLADRVLNEGGELMLEPMNPADRKVVHDAIGEIEGVRSFSEGEDPNRSVVIAASE